MSKVRIYVDTNVLVNYFTKQADDVRCLDYLFDKVRKEILFTSSLAKVQAISILQTKKGNRRKFTRSEIVDCNNNIDMNFSIIDLTNRDIQKGQQEDSEDVEDNIHFILAEKLKCDVIITNNTTDFYYFRNRIITLTPRDLGGIRRVVK